MLESPFMTVAEAATLLRVTNDTIQRRCREGTLPAIRDRKRWLIDATTPLGDQPMTRSLHPTNGERFR